MALGFLFPMCASVLREMGTSRFTGAPGKKLLGQGCWCCRFTHSHHPQHGFTCV